MPSDGLREDKGTLSPETLDRHRAIASLVEELDAVDAYQQRADGASDAELRSILEHNRDEETEHAIMLLEWLRRRSAKFDEELATYIKAPGAIVEAEAVAMGRVGAGDGATGAAPAADGSLGIGSLRSQE